MLAVRIIGLSTANGSGNFFHQLWVGSETGTNKFEPMFFPWSATEDRDDSWYESKKESMLAWQLAQEYPTALKRLLLSQVTLCLI